MNCQVEGCDKPARTKRMCGVHYGRFRRHGSTDNLRPEIGTSIEAKFWAKVEKPETCWLWTGAVQPSGHGRFRDGETNRTVSAYKWLWERVNGKVPEGLVLDHVVCDTPACVRPDHLAPTTIGANVLRGNSPTAQHARKTHCLRGHELSGDNLLQVARIRKGRTFTERICRRCARIRKGRTE